MIMCWSSFGEDALMTSDNMYLYEYLVWLTPPKYFLLLIVSLISSSFLFSLWQLAQERVVVKHCGNERALFDVVYSQISAPRKAGAAVLAGANTTPLLLGWAPFNPSSRVGRVGEKDSERLKMGGTVSQNGAVVRPSRHSHKYASTQYVYILFGSHLPNIFCCL